VAFALVRIGKVIYGGGAFQVVVVIQLIQWFRAFNLARLGPAATTPTLARGSLLLICMDTSGTGGAFVAIRFTAWRRRRRRSWLLSL